LGEYRDFGDKLPKWDDLARYIFYTETHREADAKRFDPKTGFIGSTDANGGTSYYLLYTPDESKSESMSLRTLQALAKADKNKTWVIYCEKVWLHQEELQTFQKEHGVRVRAMQVPAGVR
jgi:adenine-specific DNA-methyltransferase